MQAINTLSEEEKAAGFRLLFDGKSRDGWRNYNTPAPGPRWRVVNGALKFHPDPDPTFGHDLLSEEAFTNFELRIEWKLWKAGNSGIFYHVREVAKSPYMTGPEYQLLDDDHHPDAQNGDARKVGACYALYPPQNARRVPIGEWNTTRIIVDGDHVQHYLNGGLCAEYVLGSDDWNARVARSKFAEWPEFAKERRGHICLQDHRDPVAFRNIRIRAW